MLNKPLAHFVEEDEYEQLDEETRKKYVHVGFAHGYRLDDRAWASREQKIAMIVLVAIIGLFSAIGIYAVEMDNETLKVLAIAGAIPTLFALSLQLAIRFLA